MDALQICKVTGDSTFLVKLRERSAVPHIRQNRTSSVSGNFTGYHLPCPTKLSDILTMGSDRPQAAVLGLQICKPFVSWHPARRYSPIRLRPSGGANKPFLAKPQETPDPLTMFVRANLHERPLGRSGTPVGGKAAVTLKFKSDTFLANLGERSPCPGKNCWTSCHVRQIWLTCLLQRRESQ
jgi:hypothetical protein